MRSVSMRKKTSGEWGRGGPLVFPPMETNLIHGASKEVRSIHGAFMEVRKWRQGPPLQESGSEKKRKKAMREDK